MCTDNPKKGDVCDNTPCAAGSTCGYLDAVGSFSGESSMCLIIRASARQWEVHVRRR